MKKYKYMFLFNGIAQRQIIVAMEEAETIGDFIVLKISPRMAATVNIKNVALFTMSIIDDENNDAE